MDAGRVARNLAVVARHSETEAQYGIDARLDGLYGSPLAKERHESPQRVRATDFEKYRDEWAGEWAHFKGPLYTFIGEVATDDPTVALVFYVDGGGYPWVRPAAMIDEHVERDGYAGPRFRRV